jgi:ketosteroid isomerase-like protein
MSPVNFCPGYDQFGRPEPERMKEEGRITSVNSSEKTAAAPSEKTLATPHFNAEAIENARPAVPLAQVKPERSWPTGTMLIIAILAGLTGGIIGGILPGLYLKKDVPQTVQSEQTTDSEVVTESGRASQEQNAARTTPETTSEAAQESPDALAVGAKSDGAAPEETEATLRGALNDWVAATNARDIDKQMRFYNPVVDSFYRMRNASRDDVRADKARVFERASLVDIRTGTPAIRLSLDGRTAIMLFNKRYAIEGGGMDRRGEVIQELRWQRIDGEWRITSERDLRVVR